MKGEGPIQPRPISAGASGPETQPSEDDGAALECLRMPTEMRTYRRPALPEPDEAADLVQALGLLRALRHLLGGYRIGALPQVLDLRALNAANLRLIEESLGEGEVSILCQASPRTLEPEPIPDRTPHGRCSTDGSGHHGQARKTAQETRLAGVWRVRVIDGDGRVQRDVLEVSDVPGFVRYAAFANARSSLPDGSATIPVGVMNAPGVLAELHEQVAIRRRDGDTPPQVVNLTLLPQTEQDLVFLSERLGTGPVTILSRGYGNCRITSTRLQDVWWVQFYNSDDRLILNTLEVTDVPVAALAAQEDIDDSAARLHDILDALQ